MQSLEARHQPGYVYFMLCEGFVKIGWVTGSPYKRLDGFQIGNPHPIELLGVIETNEPALTEARFHQHLRQFHHRGEWFKIPDDILIRISLQFAKTIPFKPRVRWDGLFIKRLSPYKDLKDVLS